MMLNCQFSSVFTGENLNNIPAKAQSPYPEMPPISVNSTGVYKLLYGLNQCKASSPDNIPATILESCAGELTNMLSFIIQQSLDTGSIPINWKKSLVTPVFKKGDKANPENYRPISLTSIAAK